MRYHFGRGALFSGGVTFSALLSITAAVTIVVNVARAYLGVNPAVFALLLRSVDRVLPGLVDNGSNDGIIDPESLVVDSPWHVTTIISSVVMLWTALSVMAGLRRSIRAMFGLGGAPVPFALGKLRDLLGFVGLVVGVVLGFALAVAVGLFGIAVLDALGIKNPVTGALLALAALLAAGVADWLVFVMLFRVTAGVRVPRPDLVRGALIGAVGSGALRLLGTSGIALVKDPVLASLAAVGTLLLLVNLAVRLTLVVAAWTANPPGVPIPLHPTTFHDRETPNYVTRSVPHTLDWPHHTVTGSLQPLDGGGRVPRRRVTLRWRRRRTTP